MLRTQALQSAHLDSDQISVEHTHQNMGRIRRVGQRAQYVEHRFDAQLAPHRRHVFHRRVVIRREHKAHALLRNALRNCGR